MTQHVSLDQLRKALFQGNMAMKKRALAIIFNEAVVEAESLVREFIGLELDPDLQALSLKVLKKLQEFSLISDQVSVEALIPFLQSPDASRRILALRALLTRQSAQITTLMQEHALREQSPEALLLVAEILRHNPALGNLPPLLQILHNPVPKVRLEGFKAIFALFHGSILPLVLPGLVDPVPEVQQGVRQLLSEVNRKRLMETVEFLLGTDVGDAEALLPALLPTLQHPDLIPILKNHVQHRVPAVAQAVRQVLEMLAQKGNVEAASMLSEARPTVEPSGPNPLSELARRLRTYWETAPAWLLEPLLESRTGNEPSELIDRIRQVFDRARDLMVLIFILVYFLKANRTKATDRITFRALVEGPSTINTPQILRILAEVLPDPYGAGDFFPLLMAHRIRTDPEETVLEPFLSLHEGFKLLDDYPEEADNFVRPAIEGIEQVFNLLAGFMGSCRLLVKLAQAEGLRIFDYWGAKPIPLDAKSLDSFFLPLNSPLFLSRDSIHSVSLAPFFVIDTASGRLTRNRVDESTLWEFFGKLGIQQEFVAFQTETAV